MNWQSSTSATSSLKPPLLRIATRGSKLALWQAEYVKTCLLKEHPKLKVELLEFKTRGDRILDQPLSQVGGKGLFVKELETALLDEKADLAVHSLKDVPTIFPEGLELTTILEREHPADALIHREGSRLNDLPERTVIGTSSLRRASQILNLRPDLIVQPLRGNVITRLKKIDEGEVDAAVLAVAGLRRLELEHRISEVLEPEMMLPAIGQGVLAIEIRQGDLQTLNWIQHLDDAASRDCVTAERELLKYLEGYCQIPLAGYCIIEEENLHLKALIGAPDGTRLIRAEGRTSRKESKKLGRSVALKLLDQGGEKLLNNQNYHEKS